MMSSDPLEELKSVMKNSTSVPVRVSVAVALLAYDLASRLLSEYERHNIWKRANRHG
ncbi:MAG: hypothetical protein LC754_10435 [Acidobacteria bacterium]|nr:hypothetical protein [Acidobacteriota bacterium]